MARLHEYQGKSILRAHGIRTPRGGPAASAAEAKQIASEIGGRVVVKIQAWTTNRKALGGVAFANAAGEAGEHAGRMLGMKVGNFPVTHVLVEEMLPIKNELFVSFFIDDRERAPAMLVSLIGGSGIEERAKDSKVVRRIACDVVDGPDLESVRSLLAGSDIEKKYHEGIVGAVKGVFAAARASEARSVEVNPLVTLIDDGKGAPGSLVVAADCRVTIDDYAVFRHPELGIEIARELDHPPTELERVAYRIEQEDHRGTFFFAQMNSQATEGSRGLIGFHGAGGGGSMMSMDAITNEGFTIANFCDTSGNPSPAKVYRAARIILSQPGIIGYFGSGSGVANQEQFWSAYGLAKAFWEMDLDIPAVIRLGGNTEDRAVEILQSVCKGDDGVSAKVEGYKKTDPPAKIAARFRELVAEHLARAAEAAQNAPKDAPAPALAWKPREPRVPAFVPGAPSLGMPFLVKGAIVWIGDIAWRKNSAAIISRCGGLLRDDDGWPALAVKPEEFYVKDSEMIACEVECRRHGIEGVFVEVALVQDDPSWTRKVAQANNWPSMKLDRQSR